jgi:hypothetical protein
MKKARRDIRPGFLHDLFRLRFFARVAFQVNGFVGVFTPPAAKLKITTKRALDLGYAPDASKVILQNFELVSIIVEV